MTAVSIHDLPSPRGRPTKRAEAKQRTRQRVMAAAREMFVARGFEESTIRDIASAAELSTGAVFANFNDKNELFDAVVTESFAAMLDQMEATRRQQHASTTDRLAGMFAAAYRQFAPELPLIRAALSQAWARRECALVIERTGSARARALIEAALQTGAEAGELSENLDRPLVAELLWIAHLANYRRAVFDGWSLEVLSDRVEAQVGAVLCGYLRR